jgi:DNA topoisomerase VI subunit B
MAMDHIWITISRGGEIPLATPLTKSSIQDHGLGIPADALPKLFSKLFLVSMTPDLRPTR